MMKNLRRLLSSEFVTALSTSSFTTAVQISVGLIVNKILAITIGPSGIALMGQFTSFKDLTTNLANGSFGQGVTKYIADEDVSNPHVLATSNLFTLCCSSCLGLVVSFCSEGLSQLLFQTEEFGRIILLFGLTLPLYALNNLVLAAVNGYRSYNVLAKLKLVNSLVSLVVSTSLAWVFLLKGALLAQAINTSLVFLASVLLVRKSWRRFLSFDFSGFDSSILKKLLAFTIMAISASLLKPSVQLFIRSYILDHVGTLEAGIWEGTKRISDYYTQVVTVALSVYYLPKLSSIQSGVLLRREIWTGLKLTLPVVALLGGAIYGCRQWIVVLLFSHDFIAIADVIGIQIVGDVIMVASFIIGYIMISKALVRLFVLTNLFFAVTRVGLSLYLLEVFGLPGVFYANVINYLLFLFFMVFWFRALLFGSKMDMT